MGCTARSSSPNVFVESHKPVDFDLQMKQSSSLRP
jgi:hypothetical protein